MSLLWFVAASGRPGLRADESDRKQSPDRKAPTLAVLPARAPGPPDNPTTPEKAALGKQLFFDPRLSGDNQMSCATCHAPGKGLADGRARARGVGDRELPRNSQSVLNVGFFKSFFWDGRAERLEAQALIPIESPDEMNQPLGLLVQELAAIPGYANQFQAVFRRPVNEQDIARALAAYQRTLVTANSPFDRFLAGDRDALTPLARKGLALFKGDAGCIRCHHGPLLSDGQFYRLGVGHGDRGRGAITGKEKDLYRFRTPSLRNVSRTAPYMHDGSLETLFEVVQFYYRGVPSRGPEGLELDVEPLLAQSFSDIDAVVAFLKSLDGDLPDPAPPQLPGRQ